MSSILSIGTARPEGRLSQEQAAEAAAWLMGASEKKARALRQLYAHAGVEQRRTVVADANGQQTFYTQADLAHPAGPSTASRLEAYQLHAPDLAAQSCRRAIESSGVLADSITHLVTVSCTGMASPGVDHSLIPALGLSETVQRTNIGFMGCHGGINGLRVADAMAQMSDRNRVLLCCVELCTLHFQYLPEGGAATANALFADGAAACVLASDGSSSQVAGFSGKLFPGTNGDMSWIVGDAGFEMSLAARVPGALRAGVRPWIEPWLREHDLGVDDVSHWAIHPGGPRIVESVVDGLELPAQIGDEARHRSLELLRDSGNMSSPTVLMLLKSLLDRGLHGPVVAMAFGPGLAGEACLLRP